MTRESQPTHPSMNGAISLDGCPDVAELVGTWYPHDMPHQTNSSEVASEQGLILPPSVAPRQLILPNGEVIHIEVDPPAETI